MIPVYFLCLMADGRKLQERLPGTSTSFVADAHEGEALLITSEYPLWMAHPFDENKTAGGGVIPLRSPDVGSPGTNEIPS